MEQKCLELLKEEIKEVVSEFNFRELDLQKELLNKQIAVIDSLRELHSFKEQNNIVAKKTLLADDSEQTIEQADVVGVDSTLPENEVKEQETVLINSKPVYRFERKIIGGFIKELESFVPEAIVRKLGIENGDMLHAIPIETEDPNIKHFRYEIAEKGDGIEPSDRIQVNHCLVKKEAGYLVVDKSEQTGEYIRYEEGLYTILLNEHEVQKLMIKEGSLVDIAYPAGKPQMAKVIWVHKMEENNDTDTRTPGKKKDKNKKEEKEAVQNTLAGKTVLLVGNEPNKRLYKYAVEQRGGSFLWADAKEKLIRLEPLVKKCDLVVFLLSVSGHVGMEHIKKMCKDYGVAFQTTWSKGQSSFIRLAEESMESTA